MELEEEIAIVQFGQGIYSKENLLTRFSQLDEARKMSWLWYIENLLHPLKPTEAEIESLNASTASVNDDAPFLIIRFSGLKKVLRIRTSKGAIDQSYGLLLDLFKMAYQRCYSLESGGLTSWWYQDLSNSETVQQILTRHHELIDEIYNNPGFRSEFASLAKLWYQEHHGRKAKLAEPEPVPAVQTHFDFVTYNEMITGFLENTIYKNSRAIWLLSDSLAKALSKQYKLEKEQARRLVWEVVERHLRKTYNTGLH
ncbi:hypothetical protein HNV11_12940 [Spirosoma taeanense]|uniref:Uncharacterized protein n=1 Tax=Spirosoma taeanense TaxID=2735870 RepID=A0A6M5YA17_9BACT|nr:DUF5958 family protein [Spirosoma taeanense]QJW90216.1 hypothetical protein HNV11_12940 [Spirosoma taeanense]